MKKFLVIGGSSGIGKALVQQLADTGNEVYATYNKTIVNSTQRIQYYHHDVLSDHPDLTFVPDIIDGLVYCPGSIDLRPFTRIEPDDFVVDFNLQVIGAIKIIKATLSSLKKAEAPGIVLFSTVAVQTGFPFHSMVSTSKGAIEGLTKALAAELSPKIRVNCIAPSITSTPLSGPLLDSNEKKEISAKRHPLKTIGQPSDIASMAAYLLSDHGKWITGQVITIDGGISALKT